MTKVKNGAVGMLQVLVDKIEAGEAEVLTWRLHSEPEWAEITVRFSPIPKQPELPGMDGQIPWCTCRLVSTLEDGSKYYGGIDDCPVHGFGPGDESETGEKI